MSDERDKSDGSLTIGRVTKYLERFNRKERFILLCHVLGATHAQDVFRLNPPFRRKVGNKLDLKIPDDAFVAMDYHLDWLQVALFLAYEDGSPEKQVLHNRDPRLFEANQRDIDLLIAFEEKPALRRYGNGRLPKRIHVVLIEAKLDTGWKNDQLEEKAVRLKAIFDKKSRGLNVVPHFIMMSPRDPRERGTIDTKYWPDWMKTGTKPAHWLELPLCDGLLKVTRCDAGGKDDKDGGRLFFSEFMNGRWRKLSGRRVRRT